MVRYNDDSGVILLILALVSTKIANKWLMNTHLHSDIVSII